MVAVPINHCTVQGVPLKSARERMDIISAYREVGTYRGVAAISGTTSKTVKWVVARHESGGGAPARVPWEHNYDAVVGMVAERVEKTKGRITAKRLLPAARAMRGRRGTCGGWSRSRRRCGVATIIVAGDRRCGPRVGIWSSTGACWAGCMCSARCWHGVGSGSCASPRTSALRRGGPALVRPVRLGALLGPGCADRRSGSAAGGPLPIPGHHRWPGRG